MYVKRLRLHGVKMLHRDLPEGGGPLPEAAHRRLLFQGGNGSGKSTILAVIRDLWQLFGRCIDGDIQENEVLPLFHHAELVAIELGDIPSSEQSLWIGCGTGAAVHSLPKDANFAGVIHEPKLFRPRLIRLPDFNWKPFRHRSMVGTDPKPNIVYFPPDDRGVTAKGGRPQLIDTTGLNWLASYSTDVDLESALLTLHALRPTDFDEALKFVNLALRHRDKRIVGWGQDGRLAVEGQTERGVTYRHPTEQLSSGERQFLLMVAYVAGFLRPGGIVLIDEPDLHIHISMVTQLMQTLDHIVRQRGGQLIVASHSELVWDFFSKDDERIELTPWRGADRVP